MTSKDTSRGKGLPNPPPERLNRVTRRLEDATRRFLNRLDHRIETTRDMLDFQNWERQMIDELTALRAHYNRIHLNRRRKSDA